MKVNKYTGRNNFRVVPKRGTSSFNYIPLWKEGKKSIEKGTEFKKTKEEGIMGNKSKKLFTKQRGGTPAAQLQGCQ